MTGEGASSERLRIHRYAVVALLLLQMFASAWFGPMQIGLSVETDGEKALVSGGTNPGFLLFSLLWIALYFLLARADVAAAAHGVPGLLRRGIAFFLDFFIAMLAISPWLGLAPMLLEWRTSGEFHWQFERDFLRPADFPLAGISVALVFALLFLYFANAIKRERQTPGMFIMRTHLLFDVTEQPSWASAFKRAFFEFIGLSLWPVLPFTKKGRGRVWYDRQTGGTVVLVDGGARSISI